jgi:hypothetical protein
MQTKFLRLQTTVCCLLATAIINSCDPARIMQIRTVDKPNYSVTIYANNNILPFQNDKQNEKLVLQFPSSNLPTKTDTTFYYGLGGWHDKKSMPEFAKNFDSIIIIRNGQKQSLTDQGEITKYLLKQRHGFAKRILTIEAR